MIHSKIAFIIPLLLSMSVLAQEVDITTGAPPTPTTRHSLTPLGPATRETRILWDTSHGVYRDYNLAGEYSDLAALLALKNQHLEESAEGVLNLDLKSYDALVVNLASNHGRPYTTAEVAAIADFVASGGNLLINSDNFGTRLVNLDELGAAFGISFSRRPLLPTGMFCSDFSDWPLFEGVETVYFSWSGEINFQTPIESGGRAPTGETIVAAGRYGGGHVLVVGDVNFCENDLITAEDNQRFTENLFDALSVITVPTLSSGPLVLLVVLLMAGGLFFLRRIRGDRFEGGQLVAAPPQERRKQVDTSAQRVSGG